MAMEHTSRSSSVSLSAIQATSTNNIGVKIGGLWKRSQGVSLFTKTNYKHRVFILTEHSLSYYAGTVDRVGQIKGRLNLDSIRAVEFVDFAAFNLAHTIQVVHYSKKSGFVVLYITGTDNSEAADWATALRQACYFNKDMLMHYHPGAFFKNKWSCCNQRGRVMLGCQPTYHLLTRSSSRYAQMRRKDTLTSRQSRGRHNSSASMYSTIDRQSNITCDSINVAGMNGISRNQHCQALSNSCVDLTVHPPHIIDSFSTQQDTHSTERTSCLSTDPTFNVNNAILNRISNASSSRPSSGSDLERYVDVSMRRSSSQSLKKRSRSQVAPETSPVTPHSNFPPDNSSSEGGNVESPLVSHSSKSLRKSLDTTGIRPLPGSHSNESDHELSPPPIPPPRQKRSSSLITHSSSSHFIQRVTPISEQSTSPKAGSERTYDDHNKSDLTGTVPRVNKSLRHSKTFIAQRSLRNKVDPEVCNGRKVVSTLRGLSHSMSALTKPLIEPKVSPSNPNVIHV